MGKYHYADVGKAIANGSEEGFCKLVVEVGSERPLGAHIIGERADDIIHEAVLFMTSGSSVHLLEDIRSIHIHPTLSEVIALAAEEMPREDPDKRVGTSPTAKAKGGHG